MIRVDATYNFQKRGYVMPCLQCGRDFVAQRGDAKFCSATCRKANARRKEQIARAANKALAEIEYIRRMARDYPDLEIGAALQLDRIAEALNVSHRRGTDKRLNVTTADESHSAATASVSLAMDTDKVICPKCGRAVDYVSPFTHTCELCIRESFRK